MKSKIYSVHFEDRYYSPLNVNILDIVRNTPNMYVFNDPDKWYYILYISQDDKDKDKKLRILDNVGIGIPCERIYDMEIYTELSVESIRDIVADTINAFKAVLMYASHTTPRYHKKCLLGYSDRMYAVRFSKYSCRLNDEDINDLRSIGLVVEEYFTDSILLLRSIKEYYKAKLLIPRLEPICVYINW